MRDVSRLDWGNSCLAHRKYLLNKLVFGDLIQWVQIRAHIIVTSKSPPTLWVIVVVVAVTGGCILFDEKKVIQLRLGDSSNLMSAVMGWRYASSIRSTYLKCWVFHLKEQGILELDQVC